MLWEVEEVTRDCARIDKDLNCDVNKVTGYRTPARAPFKRGIVIDLSLWKFWSLLSSSRWGEVVVGDGVRVNGGEWVNKSVQAARTVS